VLYRVFPWLREASERDPGGAMFVPRSEQGFGRHDNPAWYGALYLSRAAVSSVAEVLRTFRRQRVETSDLVHEEAILALAAFDPPTLTLVDLDDPAQLQRRGLRPSSVATGNRRVTRPVAADLFAEGHDGFEWWSTIEASWINITLFAERSIDRLVVEGEPEVLTTHHPAVIEAAEVVGVELAG